MGEFMKSLYDKFYVPVKDVEREQEINECHQRLIEALEKPERKLVLRIMDNKDYITESLSMDSFAAGFCMAWRLCTEVICYEDCRKSENSQPV